MNHHLKAVTFIARVLLPYVRLTVIYLMGFAVRVRSAGQKYGPTCHQRDRADVTEFVTLVRLSSLGQHVGVLALAGYKRQKSALTAGPGHLHFPFRATAWSIVVIKLDSPLASMDRGCSYNQPESGPPTLNLLWKQIQGDKHVNSPDVLVFV